MSKLLVSIVDRGSLADVLRGVSKPTVEAMEVREGRLVSKLCAPNVGVGYVEGRLPSLPHFVVIPGSDRREFFAWVSTYCPFATPLTQWCRVISEEELKRFQSLEVIPQYGKATSAWAGAIIGEALLHIGTGVKLSQLSVPALQSCSSFVAARAFGLWGTEAIRNISSQIYENARKLLGVASRGPSLADFQPIWTVLEALTGQKADRICNVSSQLQLIVQSCEDVQQSGFVSEEIILKMLKELGWSDKYKEYERAGSEQRLELFDSSVANLFGLKSGAKHNRKVLAEFMVAYFAVRIGGSVSAHIQLIEKLLNQYPTIALWYGVASALYKPEVWGTEFFGLGRLTLKELAYPLRFDDPPRCDITFDELTSLVGPTFAFPTIGFRGATRTALNVEVSLGVNGMIRLAAPSEPERDVDWATAKEVHLEAIKLLGKLEDATETATQLTHAFALLTSDQRMRNRDHSRVRQSQPRSKSQAGESRDRQLPLDVS